MSYCANTVTEPALKAVHQQLGLTGGQTVRVGHATFTVVPIDEPVMADELANHFREAAVRLDYRPEKFLLV